MVALSFGSVKTPHTSVYDFGGPDSFIMVVRVAEERGLCQNSLPIDFSTQTSCSYRVVGSCHHRGSLKRGHWVTKILTKRGWFELDYLKSHSSRTKTPGMVDQTVG